MDGFEPGCNTAENSAFQSRDAVLGKSERRWNVIHWEKAAGISGSVYEACGSVVKEWFRIESAGRFRNALLCVFVTCKALCHCRDGSEQTDEKQ